MAFPTLTRSVRVTFMAACLTIPSSLQCQDDGDGWTIWVRDENQVDQAKEALEDYRHNPEKPAYRGVERAAESLRREQQRKHEASRKNVVEMRGRWGRPGARRRPLTLTIVALCVVIGLVSNMGRSRAVIDPLRGKVVARDGRCLLPPAG